MTTHHKSCRNSLPPNPPPTKNTFTWTFRFPFTCVLGDITEILTANSIKYTLASDMNTNNTKRLQMINIFNSIYKEWHHINYFTSFEIFYYLICIVFLQIPFIFRNAVCFVCGQFVYFDVMFWQCFEEGEVLLTYAAGIPGLAGRMLLSIFTASKVLQIFCSFQLCF